MLLPITAMILCAALIVQPWIERIFQEIAPSSNAAKIEGRLQLQITDLLLTAFCYGAGLSVVLCLQPGANRGFVAGAIYLLVAEALGLIAAMDVCRKTPYTNDKLQRSSIFLIFFIVFPLALPAALLAWNRWSKRVAS